MALPIRNTKTTEIAGLDTFYNGGKGSGNFGHSGRPGEVGGSGDGQGKVTKEKRGGEMSEDKAKEIIEGVSRSVSGEYFDELGSFKKLLQPVQEGNLSKKQVERLLIDGKPQLTLDKKTIYYSRTAGDLATISTTPEESIKDLAYERKQWKKAND